MVEVFGWLLLVEGGGNPLFRARGGVDPAHSNAFRASYPLFRLVGFLISGLGMLYIASGRLNAGGFILAPCLIDRWCLQ